MRSPSRPSQRVSQKILYCFQQAEGEKTFWKSPEHSILLNKICPQEKLFTQILSCWGFIKALPNWEGGEKYPTPVSSRLLCGGKEIRVLNPFQPSCPTKGSGGTETLVKFTVQGHRLHNSLNQRPMEHFSPPTPSCYILKAYLPQFLFSIE